MKSKNIVWIIILILVIGIAIWFKINKDKEAAVKIAPVTTKGQPVLVSAVAITSQSLDNKIQATGSIMANEEVALQSETAGKIIGLYIQEGSMVKKGDLLIKINDGELQAQLKKAEYSVQSDLLNEAREKKLLEIKGISEEEYENAWKQWKSAQADIELIKAQIAKTELRAPFDGVIGLKNVSEGSYISNGTVVANLVELDPVKIDFSIPEKYMNQVRKGDEIIFSVAGTNQKYTGTIYAIEPRIDITSRTLQVRAKASNKGNQLLAGAFASVELVMEHLEHVLMIPTQSIIPGLKNQKVFICKDGKAQPVMVETGIRTDALIQITKGLQEGDSVITTGMNQLRLGLPVKILNN